VVNSKHIRKNRRRLNGPRFQGWLHAFGTLLNTAGMLTALAGFSLLLILGYDVVTQCGLLNAHFIQVNGTRHLSRQEVLAQAGIREGANVLGVNLDVARKRLLANAWIREASVTRRFPPALVIAITEHRPLAVVSIGDSAPKRYLLDAHGALFKSWTPRDSSDLPEVTGLGYADLDLGSQMHSPAFEAMMQILVLGAGKDSVLPNSAIGRIRMDRDIGATITAWKGKRMTLGFGHYEEKLQRLARVMQYMKQLPELSDFRSIDLNRADRVVIVPLGSKPAEKRHKEV
jgi:cell division protein FtsQ